MRGILLGVAMWGSWGLLQKLPVHLSAREEDLGEGREAGVAQADPGWGVGGGLSLTSQTQKGKGCQEPHGS